MPNLTRYPVKPSVWTIICTLLIFCVGGAITASAQTFTSLASFNFDNGDEPEGPMVQDSTGNFYGTTSSVGTTPGVVYKMTSDGTLTALYSFCSVNPNCADGSQPSPVIVLGTDGNLYGTTALGGANNTGTFFKMTLAGALTTIASFPAGTSYGGGALIQGADSNFYGTSPGTKGGTNTTSGSVFKLTSDGTLSSVYTFCTAANCTDGADPEGSLIQGTDGNLYGTTFDGGANNSGSVYKLTTTGTLSTLYSFCAVLSGSNCNDGNSPAAGVIQGSDGNFYGTTPLGGANTFGSVYKLTPAGVLTTLYSLCAQTTCTDGKFSYGSLVEAQPNVFLGTAQQGGANGKGLIFEIDNSGSSPAASTLYSFCAVTNCTDGRAPYAGLLKGSDGNFYGTTQLGGANSDGTTYSLDAGLGSTPSFTLSATAVSVAPSSSGTSTVTITDVNGFSASVALTVTSTLPTGVTAAFNPTSATTTSTLTFTTDSTAVAGETSVTIQGVSGGITQTTTVDLTVTSASSGSYSLSAGAASPASINAGASATSTITVTPANGYTGTVTLACAVTPVVTKGPTCSFTGSPVTISGDPATATLTVNTTAAGSPSAAIRRDNGMFLAMLLPFPGLALLGVGIGSSRRKKLITFALLAIALTMLIGLSACGGSSNNNNNNGGTPSGTYTVTVTGMDGNNASQSNTAPTVTVVVN